MVDLPHYTHEYTLHRSCAGQHFASESLFISVSMMLWALDFTPATDREGKAVLPSANEWIDNGIVL